MALPFGLGCAIAYGLYHEFSDEPGTEPVKFGTYVLFIGMSRFGEEHANSWLTSTLHTYMC